MMPTMQAIRDTGDLDTWPPEVQGTHLPALVLSDVALSYGTRVALDAVDLAITRGEIVAVLGASGSGKSTLLRLVAGLERPSRGRIVIDGSEVAGNGKFVGPEYRRVGMMFQDYALFPHLSVAENVAFGLRQRTQKDRVAIVSSLLETIELRDRADAYPHMLSGGERQRVALARALAPEPDILLMDEPFSGLDDRLRDQVREQTMAIVRRARTTTVLVTHDASEAFRVADRIALIDHGRLIQVGRPEDLYRRPASLHAACAFGHVNQFLVDNRGGRIDTPIGTFVIPEGRPTESTCMCIRPQHIRLTAEGNGPHGVVSEITFQGESTDIAVRLPDWPIPIIARVLGRPTYQTGTKVYLSADVVDLIFCSTHGNIRSHITETS